MSSFESETIWHARPPAEWPSLPKYLTYSTLRELEACPRRWGLSSAQYPNVWSGRGYPPRLSISRLAGTIVHDVIEKVTHSLVEARCVSLQTAEAVEVMRDLGGFTRLFENSTEGALRMYAANPRADWQLEAVRRVLQSHFADLRRRTQALLTKVTLQAPSFTSDAVSSEANLRSEDQRREALPSGTYSEVVVLAQEMGWKGKIDLLTVSNDECKIVDFKTGEPSDEHALQVQMYALLWSLDKSLNPHGALATSLTVAYTNSQTEVPPPTVEALAQLRIDLLARTDSAKGYERVRPPARPSADNCTHCDVRHMCDEYWTRAVQASLEVPASRTDVCDGEFVLGTRVGASNWEITPRVAPAGWRSARTVLRCSEPRVELRSGQTVRVLDGRVWTEPNEPDVRVVNVGPSSEIYVV